MKVLGLFLLCLIIGSFFVETFGSPAIPRELELDTDAKANLLAQKLMGKSPKSGGLSAHTTQRQKIHRGPRSAASEAKINEIKARFRDMSKKTSTHHTQYETPSSFVQVDEALRPTLTKAKIQSEPLSAVAKRAAVAPASSPAILVETAGKQKFIGALMGAAMKIGSSAMGQQLGGAALDNASAGWANAKRMPQDVEDCVSCRYVWLQVEMEIGNSQIEENIYDAFTRACIDAQQAPIFYPSCQDMFDVVDDMIGDYMDGFTINQMCENSRICR